jgi:hypothetical protein
MKGWGEESFAADSRAMRTAAEALSFMLGLNNVPIDLLTRSVLPVVADTEIGDSLDIEKFLDVRRTVGWSVFDTRRWQRSGADF